MPRAKQTPCLCSQCHGKTFTDGNGNIQPGVLLDPRTKRKHEREERRQTVAVAELKDVAINHKTDALPLVPLGGPSESPDDEVRQFRSLRHPSTPFPATYHPIDR